MPVIGPDFVALLGNLPGDVADQTAQRYKQKIPLFHSVASSSLKCLQTTQRIALTNVAE